MVANQCNAVYRFLKVLLVLILLFASLLIIGLFVPWKNSCRPSQFDPHSYSPKNLENLVSDDYKAIANLLGYINYPNNSDYLPIYLTTVKYNSKPSPSGGDDVELTLGSQCSELVIEIYLNDQVQIVKKVAMQRIYMHQDDLECSIEQLNFRTSPEYYYTCKNFSMKCENRLSHQEAIVRIDVLKFEINGRPDEMKKGLFSKNESIYCDSSLKVV